MPYPQLVRPSFSEIDVAAGRHLSELTDEALTMFSFLCAATRSTKPVVIDQVWFALRPLGSAS